MDAYWLTSSAVPVKVAPAASAAVVEFACETFAVWAGMNVILIKVKL
jgi:hypothetical protein